MISNDLFNAIEALDLGPIKLKLMHKTFGEGWSQSKADAMETEYRRFLYLQAAFPDEQTAPTLDVDAFWHYHILDTMKYSADCEQAFGYFLHHYPYLGMIDGDEPDLEVEAGNRTRELYEATFGQDYIHAEAYGDDDSDVGATKCEGVFLLTKPAIQGQASAQCQGMCVASRPALQRRTSARCNAVCIVGTPAAQGGGSARCNAVCIVGQPAAQGNAGARC